MRNSFLLAASCVIAISTAALAAPRTFTAEMERPLAGAPAPLPAPAAKAAVDTFWFGGTHWDAAQSRWEANVSTSRTNRWTFDSGVGGDLEGWTGRDGTLIPLPTVPVGNPDNSDFRWTNSALYALYGTPGTNLFPASTPPDTGGIWCSKYKVETDELCYSEGQGYGNSWRHEARKTFAYGGSGDVRITYKYFNNSEKGFDYTYLYLEFDDVREAHQRLTMVYILGSPTSKRLRTLTIAASSVTPGTSEITTVFQFSSDSGWSDEDGLGWQTAYGAFCCYNFKYEDLGTPANDDEDTFEEGPEGWQFFQKPGVGDFVAATNLADLPPPESAGPCADAVISGNVLTLFDRGAPPEGPLHPPDQDNGALSPYIDLAEAGLSSSPVRLVVGDAYMWLPLTSAVYYKVWLRSYPVLCERTGAFMEADVAPDPFLHIAQAPTCYDDRVFADLTGVTGDIDFCRIELEVLELCATSTACTSQGGNTTPWFDNVGFAVYGAPVGVEDGSPRLPALPELAARPNPFWPSVRIEYSVPAAGPVALRIYDVNGALVRTLVERTVGAGRFEQAWDGLDDSGRAASAGVYWARCSAGGHDVARRLVLLK